MKARPMSPGGMSTFGNSKTIKDLSLTPKVAHYSSNGSGRDSYINFSNGGFRKKWENNYTSILTLKTSRGDISKPVRVDSKVVIYKSNGFGRDSYITTSCGGFFRSQNIIHPSQFGQSLRQYTVKSTPKKHDFLYLSQTFVRKELKPIFNNLLQKQRAQSARLSKPKVQSSLT